MRKVDLENYLVLRLFSKKHFTKLANGLFQNIGAVCKHKENLDTYHEFFSAVLQNVEKTREHTKIYKVQNTFHKAACDSWECFCKEYDSLDTMLQHACDSFTSDELLGCFIMSDEENDYYYLFDLTGSKFKYIAEITYVRHLRCPLFTLGYCWINGKLSSLLPTCPDDKIEESRLNGLSVFLCVMFFKHYAEIEKVKIGIISPEKNKNISRFAAKQSADVLFTIEELDSKWYTEYIRTTGFKVRGHWRLQPYREGKKLIFISPYMKHGYHRRAKLEHSLCAAKLKKSKD